MQIELRQIAHSYGDKHLYEDFSLSIAPSACVCLLGPSGIGKTTLIKMIAGLIAPSVGEAIPKSNIRFVDAANSKEALEAYYQVLFEALPKLVGGKLPDEGFYYEK